MSKVVYSSYSMVGQLYFDAIPKRCACRIGKVNITCPERVVHNSEP